jgi:UDP-glucose 4-epimerase
MNTCLVTGASGFVGKKLINALLYYDHKVLPVSRKSMPNENTIICDFETSSLSKLHMKNVDVIYHLAGVAHDQDSSSSNQSLYQLINVDATIRLAELAASCEVRNFIFLSSVKAGGLKEPNSEVNEIDNFKPEGIYGYTKRKAELKLLEIGQKSKMDVAIVRSSLVYGPDVKGNLKLMMDGIKKGWFPPFPKVNNSRSMIHIDDLIQALILVTDNKKAIGEIFIATDGKSYSTRDIYEAFCNELGKPIPKWSFPSFFLKLVGLLSVKIQYKVDKLLGDEYYSSKKINSIGFEPQKTFKDMNETSF